MMNATTVNRVGTDISKKRIEWVDVVKFICIIFVMVSHLELKTEILETFYLPFFLMGFFFVSGYVYRHRDSFSIFIAKKAKTILLPWAIFSVFNILLSQVFSFNEHEGLLHELFWNFMQVRGYGDEVWFLPALFVAFIPFYFFIKWYHNSKLSQKKRVSSLLIVSLALSVLSFVYTEKGDSTRFVWQSTALPWHLEYVFQAMFFMVLGFLYKEIAQEKLDRFFGFFKKALLFCVYVFIAFLPLFIDFKNNIFIYTLWLYIVQMTGVLALVYVSKGIKSNRYISYVGQNTLIYFALHGKVYSVIQTMLHKFAENIYTAIMANVFVSSISAILFSLALSVILIVPAYIINRFFPFVVGKPYKKK